MSLDAWLAVAAVVCALVALAATRIGPDLILAGTLTALIVFGVLTPEDALAGFANPGLATVAVLYIVVAGLMETGAVNAVAEALLGRPRHERQAQLRLMLPVMGASAFLNNTPVVAMLVPAVQSWARRNNLSTSRLLLPLSYAAILGGTCTLVGTSTNLIVAGLAAADPTLPPIGFFAIAWLGVPSALVGLLYVIGASRWLLPDRRPAVSENHDPKEYAVEMVVMPDSPIVGRTIEKAGLRHLPGLYLAEIERAGVVLPAVSPNERLQGDDRLVFVGMVDSVPDLYRIRGLLPAPDQIFKLDSPRPERHLIEAVISETSPLAGQTIRGARVRSMYGAVVIAVARAGKRIPGKLGDIELRPGDTLLLEARPSFTARHRNSRDFLLISALDGATPPRHDRFGVAIAILAGMVAAVTFAGVAMLTAALVAAGLMIATRCTSAAGARRSIDWSLLIVIGASLGLGRALELTGAAGLIADRWIGLTGANPWLMLLGIYLLTSLLTEVITNNAAAVLMYAIARSAAAGLGVSFLPFVFVIMMAASASFATPIGYQTNLMVYGPGGYRFTDYVRFGAPLNLLLLCISVLIAPWVWPF